MAVLNRFSEDGNAFRIGFRHPHPGFGTPTAAHLFVGWQLLNILLSRRLFCARASMQLA